MELNEPCGSPGRGNTPGIEEVDHSDKELIINPTL